MLVEQWKNNGAFQFENPQEPKTAITSVSNHLPTPGKQPTICEDVWEAKKSYPKHDLSVGMIKVNYGDPQPPGTTPIRMEVPGEGTVDRRNLANHLGCMKPFK